MSSIFVAIASYRDVELYHTVSNLINKASKSNLIHLGIHTQGTEADRLNLKDIRKSNYIKISYRHSPLENSHGVGWARNVAQKFFESEEYYLQIDAHVQLTENWDDILIKQLNLVKDIGPVVLTAYLPGYKMSDEGRTVAHRLPTRFKVIMKNGFPTAIPVVVEGSALPQKTYFFAGGFCFSSGDFVENVPYDPDIFFFGEEASMAIRAYCSGYNLYTPGTYIGAHLYGTKTAESVIEPRSHRFWDADDDTKRQINWYERDQTSKSKVAKICRGEWSGVYGVNDSIRYKIYREALQSEFGIDLGLVEYPINTAVMPNTNSFTATKKCTNKRGSLTVVGAGIKAIAQMTLEAIAAIRNADIVFYNPTSGVMVSKLMELNPNCVNLRRFYGEGKERQITYIQMTDALLREVWNGKNVVAVFHGHPGFFVSTSRYAISIARSDGYNAKMIPGVSSIDNLLADLGIDPGMMGLHIIKAGKLLKKNVLLAIDDNVIIVQPGVVGNSKFSFSGMKNTKQYEMFETLERLYGAEQEIILYRSSDIPGLASLIDRRRISDFKINLNSISFSGTNIYIPPRGYTYQQVLDKQIKNYVQPRAAVGQAIFTPLLEEITNPIGFKDSIASPAYLALMEKLANDADHLSNFERDPNNYLEKRFKLSSDELQLFSTLTKK